MLNEYQESRAAAAANMDRTGYQSLIQNNIDTDDRPPLDQDIVGHHGQETNKMRWNHIEDLDSFFTRVYYYHQKHGFVCILLKECFELLQFVFVVVFATFLMQCVDYPILFKDKLVNATDVNYKVKLHDAFIPASTCIAGFSFYMWFTLGIALTFWTIRLIFVGYNTVLNWEIRAFYRTALGIQDSELDNLTWYDVQKRLREVQREHQMCIHKQDLTELDIYHRILRFKNYMIAMMNKSVLPLKFDVPLIGEVVLLTHGLKFNLELLLFWGPWAPFSENWHLREDYKKTAKRKELANALSKRILWVGLANLALSPIIFLWQILYSFFNYAEVVKREPGTLGMRKWSLYGRLYLRHFNELEHEINGRLSRAYRPAAKYMSIFNTPALTVLAQNIAFVAGAFIAVLSVLAIHDEDVLTVEHVLLIISVSGAAVAISRAFIPDEQLVWCPERLLTAVLAHVHYFPDQWKGQAHTSRTRDQFALLFQYKAVYLLEELLSPFVTPIVLCFHLRSRALDIVDFYRNFTVEVVGVGDVCSFAQMDVRKHGNAMWQSTISEFDGSDHPNNNNPYLQAENGKTELSLVHFTHMNPEWQPPSDSGAFILNLKERAAREASVLPTVLEENPFYASLNSVSSMGEEYSTAVQNLMRENNLLHLTTPLQFPSFFGDTQAQAQENIVHTTQIPPTQSQQQNSFRGYVSKHEGPIQQSQMRGIVSGTQQSMNMQGTSYGNISFANSFAQYPPVRSNYEFNTVEASTVDMSLDALYMHEIHHLEMRKRGGAVPGVGHPSASTYFRPPSPVSTSQEVSRSQGFGETQGNFSPSSHQQIQYFPMQHTSNTTMNRNQEKMPLLGPRNV